MFLGAVLKHKVLLGGIFIVAISAIIIERALNDILLDLMQPWAVFGLGILVFASAWIFVSRRPSVPFWVLIVVGMGLILYGQGVA